MFSKLTIKMGDQLVDIHAHEVVKLAHDLFDDLASLNIPTSTSSSPVKSCLYQVVEDKALSGYAGQFGYTPHQLSMMIKDAQRERSSPFRSVLHSKFLNKSKVLDRVLSNEDLKPLLPKPKLSGQIRGLASLKQLLLAISNRDSQASTTGSWFSVEGKVLRIQGGDSDDYPYYVTDHGTQASIESNTLTMTRQFTKENLIRQFAKQHFYSVFIHLSREDKTSLKLHFFEFYRKHPKLDDDQYILYLVSLSFPQIARRYIHNYLSDLDKAYEILAWSFFGDSLNDITDLLLWRSLINARFYPYEGFELNTIGLSSLNPPLTRSETDNLGFLLECIRYQCMLNHAYITQLDDMGHMSQFGLFMHADDAEILRTAHIQKQLTIMQANGEALTVFRSIDAFGDDVGSTYHHFVRIMREMHTGLPTPLLANLMRSILSNKPT